MGIETFPRYQSYFIDHKSPAWDPCATLEIVNPDQGYLTCVGYAPSKRRRCRNRISAGNQSCVYKMLEALANTSLDSRSIESQLENIAALSLCRGYHQNQIYSVVDQWLSRISLMESLLRRQGSQFDYEDLETRHAQPKTARGSNWQSWSSASHAPDGLPRTSKLNYQAREPDSPERQQGEDRGRWEQKRREAEQAAQEQQERERKASAERKRQNEKLRQQAAQQKREEQQKQADEKAGQERKAWDQAWENYVKGWAVFKEGKQENTSHGIPWPVRSGRRDDVTEANVKIFFQKAPPDASIPAAMFKTMSMENLKWHPDKISSIFRGERPEDVAMIGRIVIQLRATAQTERNKG